MHELFTVLKLTYMHNTRRKSKQYHLPKASCMYVQCACKRTAARTWYYFVDHTYPSMEVNSMQLLKLIAVATFSLC